MSKREIIFNTPLPETVFDHQVGRHEFSHDCRCNSCELLAYRKMTHREGSVGYGFHSYRGATKDNHDGRRTLLDGVKPHERKRHNRKHIVVMELAEQSED